MDKEYILKTYVSSNIDNEPVIDKTYIYQNVDALLKGVLRYKKFYNSMDTDYQQDMSYSVEEREVKPWTDVTASFPI